MIFNPESRFFLSLSNKQKITIMNNSEYITPTKENPIFVAAGTTFGNIDNGFYKYAEVQYSDNCTSVMPTFALNFQDAISNLIEYAAENKSFLISENCNLELYLIDGTLKHDQPNFKKVFTLNQNQIKLL